MYIYSTILAFILLFSSSFALIVKRDASPLFKKNANTTMKPSAPGLTPGELESNEQLNQNILYEQTVEFSNSLVLFENIVIAAYTVANYSNVGNDKTAEFWKNIIPILVKSLKDDVNAHSLIVKSISSIRDLSLVIQDAGQLVMLSEGSPKSIEIAQKNIPEALEKLVYYNKSVSNIQTSAIDAFGKRTNEIFQIIGPEAVKFVEQRADIDKEFKNLYVEQQTMYTQIASKQAELAGLNYLLNATQKELYGAEAALSEAKQRSEALKKLNLEVENTIKTIPISTTQYVTTTTHYRSGFLWFWGSDRTSSETKRVVVPNPDRDSEVKYYENIVNSRMERIRENDASLNATNSVIKDLKNSLDELTIKYNETEAVLKNMNNILGSKLTYIQERLNNLTNNLREINKKEKNISDAVGVGGQALIQCLTSVKQISDTLRKGVNGYSTLGSILTGIHSLVNSEVQMLGSSNSSDVFLADVLLLKKVGFLANYVHTAQQYLLSSKEFNSVVTKIQLIV